MWSEPGEDALEVVLGEGGVPVAVVGVEADDPFDVTCRGSPLLTGTI
ncbi:MAG TPA: hypothetical protein VKZ91_00355 [Woeseiaceae bacterium]|nr:hypothetical protein [Woeseiaceae bacterium]